MATENYSWDLTCFSSVFNPNGKNLQGDNIIVPQRILEDIQNIETTKYQFVIKNSFQTQGICCRVEEFHQENNNIYIPSWMMHNLYLNDMDEVKLSLLESEIYPAKKLLVQPHDSIFLTLDDHKTALEDSLKKFSSLTKGTSVSICYHDEEFSLSIIEVEPQHQFVSLIDTDIEVDFMPPLDYVEVKPNDWPESEQWPLDPGVYIKEEILTTPKQYILSNGKQVIIREVSVSPLASNIITESTPAPAPAPPKLDEAEADPQEKKFIPFSGKGNRLGN